MHSAHELSLPVGVSVLGTALALVPASLLVATLVTTKLGDRGAAVYKPAGWTFADDGGVLFDNTALTWGTDIGIGVLCGAFSVGIWQRSGLPANARRLQLSCCALLCLMMTSTLSGAAAHWRHDGTAEMLRGETFRSLWYLVVGCTLAVGGVVGLIAGEIARLGGAARVLPPEAWAAWIVVLEVLMVGGWMSFTRPAADIFFAGATQSLPTLMLQAALHLYNWRPRVGRTTYWVLQAGLLLNAPLVVTYPLLVGSGWSLGAINTYLHANLALSWGMQGFGLSALLDTLAYRADEVGRETAATKKRV